MINKLLQQVGADLLVFTALMEQLKELFDVLLAVGISIGLVN